MPDSVTASPDLTAPPLSETQRVVDTFVAPSKTFTDILRKATFWGPLVIMILVSVGFSYAVQQKVGWEKVFDNNLHQAPSREEQFEKLSPEQQTTAKAAQAKGVAVTSYGATVGVLLITLITSLLVWLTVNLGFGGTSTYGKIFAVHMYGTLVLSVKYILAIITLFAGVAPDSFLFGNPVGSNVGYYLQGMEVPLWVVTMASFVDAFAIWSLVLSTIGVAIVAKVSRGKAAAAVVGWYIVFVLVMTGLTAAFS